MIIIAQIAGSGLTDLAVDETTFASQTSNTFEMFLYDGADWTLVTPGESGTVDLNDYGIVFNGTPVANDSIAVAYQPAELNQFSAGDGINCIKLNENFAELQTQSNNNENSINVISNQALLKDGSNLTAQIVDDFRKQPATVLSSSGTISLLDNSANFLTLTGNAVISLPTISSDDYSHTILLVVAGSAYSLDVQTATGGHHLYNPIVINTENPYNVMFVFNKLDNNWYYSITQ